MVRLLATEPRGTRASWGPDPLAQSVPLVQLVLPLPTCYLQLCLNHLPNGQREQAKERKAQRGGPGSPSPPATWTLSSFASHVLGHCYHLWFLEVQTQIQGRGA